MGLVHHLEINAVICTIHRTALKRSYVLRHLETKHRDLPLNKAHVRTMLAKWGIADQLPELSGSQYHPQIQGLPISCGFACPDCGVIRTTPKLVREHVSKEHNKPLSVKPRLQVFPVQRLGAHSTLFPILPSDHGTITTNDIAIQKLTAEVEKTFQTPVGTFTDNSRLISPWLHTTKWPLMVKDHDVDKLVAFCQQPTANDGVLTRASRIVRLMNAYGVERIGVVPDLILERLNTPDAVKGHVSLLYKWI